MSDRLLATARRPAALTLAPSLLCVCIGAWLSAAAAQPAPGQLPPPPRAPMDLGEQTVELELVVNRLPSAKVVPVALRDEHYWVDAATLRVLDVRAEGEGPVAVDALAGVQVVYDAANLRLLIDVPADWLPSQRFGRHSSQPRYPARSSVGALFNYDVYTASPQRGRSSTSAWSEIRLFGPFGAFSSTGVYRHGGAGDGYVRYDTRWQFSDEDQMLTWEAGDLVTRSLSWGSTVRMAGLQLSRDFSVRPDVITYPLPQFSGEAAVPTAVDLFINGNRASSTQINPGPFTVTNVPFISGAGNAVVVVTDALGRQVSTSLPFYVSNELLRPGLSDFSFGLGALRRDYGIRDFSYGRAAAQGSYRYGASDAFTLEAHGEAARSLGVGGLGGLLKLGNAGVLNASYSRSRHEGEAGYQAVFGYQYTAHRFNLAMQQTRRDRGYADLATYDSVLPSPGRRTLTSASASVALGRYGSLGAAYFDIEGFDGDRNRLLNLSWSVSPWRNSSLYLSANREIGGDDWSAMAQWVVPLDGDRGSLSASVERYRERGDTYRTSYNRAVPSQGGFGWNLAYADSDRADSYQQADLSYRNDVVLLRAGLYGSSGDYTRWAEASGSLVYMAGSAFAANQVNDAFVIVDTNGYADVPVRYENQLVGTTNARGRLLVPWAAGFYGGKYTIDPLQLPPQVETPLVEQNVAVRRGSGYLLRFPVQRVVAASIVLHGADGKPLPVGAVATTADGRSAYVGWDGLLYLSGLQSQNTIEVGLPDGSRCTASFQMNVERSDSAPIGPLTCQ
ncbi:fimbria/pilus outer membrane usher protein [Lysobacter enzymogenes]|uniref:fimbria/pilus outer membrane usher protein n=1 Tax=Lysobacter enzymogenes TaxID=69 RepID=UPI00099CE22B|nr:fimbria/pilus outer membrane usher protein [Lysobacter enzymogenes]UZW62194.1 fimbria/pilus outer membrane usher protein [Lysobacter enzymogenes]